MRQGSSPWRLRSGCGLEKGWRLSAPALFVLVGDQKGFSLSDLCKHMALVCHDEQRKQQAHEALASSELSLISTVLLLLERTTCAHCGADMGPASEWIDTPVQQDN